MIEFWMCFVPLFVAVDAIGSMPLFLGLTQGMSLKDVTTVIIESVLTAGVVAIAFLFGGTALLRLLGITIADFMVAGGVIIFAIAIGDLLSSDTPERKLLEGRLGAVPLGVPLITGPAVLTTSLLLLDTYGWATTAGALLANIAIAGLLFFFAGQLTRVLGSAGATVISKVANLLMASIGVMIIRKGLAQLLGNLAGAVGT
ncbi:MAG TPA: MarC family protein [Deltaproteobacteria bacterium]|nr:MarC family protein [Deltaproteobacteria bacterium]HOI06136.1 MarC family protein [Deltaproteobacteria bacterium]